MKQKKPIIILYFIIATIFFIPIAACDVFSKKQCKPRMPDLVTNVLFDLPDMKATGEVKVYSNKKYDCCKSWLDDDAFESLSSFVLNKSSIDFEPFNIVLYLKGLISNDTIINENDIYGFSCYDYNHNEQTLRMCTFIRDLKTNKFFEIKELDTFISGWIVNYIDIIANELIVEFVNNDKTAINFYSYSKATSIGKSRIRKKLWEDNFIKLVKKYIESKK